MNPGKNTPEDGTRSGVERPLGPTTRTTLGVAGATLCTLVGAALWIQNGLAENRALVTLSQAALEKRLDLMEQRIDFRLRSLEEATDDRWTRSAMRAWARELRLGNPSLTVPQVDDR